MKTLYTIPLAELGMEDTPTVGGKNASLGQMMRSLKDDGVRVPDGFATTADAFRLFLRHNHLEARLGDLMAGLDTATFSNLNQTGLQARLLILNAAMPPELAADITSAYQDLCARYGLQADVAVRSSATAEDLPDASFAGQHDSYLNRRGPDDVVNAVQCCYASLFNDRAIKYRHDNGFDHMKTALSAGVQLMVRADKGSAGVCFTLDPESGFRNVVVLTSCWGLGENIVQGAVNPDEFVLFKPSLRSGHRAVINRKLGAKAKTMIYAEEHAVGSSLVNTDTAPEKRLAWSLSDNDAEQIGRWALAIEDHYARPMDIEWVKDGLSGELFIVQARPETVHARRDPYIQHQYELTAEGVVLASGAAVGSGIATGVVRLLQSPADAWKLAAGEVLLTGNTNPDWDPIMKKASAIITDKGGRTSHAAIVAREVGAVAVVGCGNATDVIRDGQVVTVSCAEGKTGHVYDGALPWKRHDVNFRNVAMPATAPMLIVADPEKAFRLSFYPNRGVGLMRLEFVISNVIRAHPMALARFDLVTDPAVRGQIEELTAGYENGEDYFTDKLSQAVATMAAAFWPNDVIVRMSDFKTNEYANLTGGKEFEPDEENPMIGFRGASRYYNPRYRPGFALECRAMKIVRDQMGLTNVKLMIPFCRTVDEGRRVVQVMEEYGLKRGENALEIYVMAEIPSNVILARQFAEVFDGFSIGSNDLTQLTLGLDRDSTIVSELFDENNPAVKTMIANVVRDAHACGRPVGLCGQAPSDSPQFAQFLVELGIDSISFNPDALLKGMANMVQAEGRRLKIDD